MIFLTWLRCLRIADGATQAIQAVPFKPLTCPCPSLTRAEVAPSLLDHQAAERPPTPPPVTRRPDARFHREARPHFQHPPGVRQYPVCLTSSVQASAFSYGRDRRGWAPDSISGPDPSCRYQRGVRHCRECHTPGDGATGSHHDALSPPLAGTAGGSPPAFRSRSEKTAWAWRYSASRSAL
jgi:hypothetical protein